MQQYRVNYSLLIGLIVGTFLFSGAVYGVWRFQIERKSGWLVGEAEKSRGEKDYRDAVQFYGQYLSVHPEDKDARLKFANSYIDLAEQDDAGPEDLGAAMQILEGTLRRPDMMDVPEAKALRRRLVDLYGRDNVRNYSGALDHLNLLLESDPNNAELQVLRASYLMRSGNLDDAIKYSYQLIGYDPKADKFDVKKATAPHSAEVYANLAGLLHGKQNKPVLAERVMNQLIEVNPSDADAYVNRGRLRTLWGDADGARSDAQKAYQLKPEDSDVLLLIANTAVQQKDFDKARQYIAAAKKLHPKESRLYQTAASLDLQENKYPKALAELDEGVKAVDGAAGINLQFFKARLQIESKDIKGARQTIDDMLHVRKLQPEVLDYFDAIILFAEGKWYPASEALSKLRPRMGGFTHEMATEIDYDLALCYERLGRFELAQQYYDLIVQQNPENAPAVAGAQRMKRNWVWVQARAPPTPYKPISPRNSRSPRTNKIGPKSMPRLKSSPKSASWMKQTSSSLRPKSRSCAKITKEQKSC